MPKNAGRAGARAREDKRGKAVKNTSGYFGNNILYGDVVVEKHGVYLYVIAETYGKEKSQVPPEKASDGT